MKITRFLELFVNFCNIYRHFWRFYCNHCAGFTKLVTYCNRALSWERLQTKEKSTSRINNIQTVMKFIFYRLVSSDFRQFHCLTLFYLISIFFCNSDKAGKDFPKQCLFKSKTFHCLIRIPKEKCLRFSMKTWFEIAAVASQK